MTVSYCMKCRTKTPDSDAKLMAAKGRTMRASKCAVCGTRKSQFVAKGKGILGATLGSLLPF